MVRKCRPPRVKDAGHGTLCAEVSWISCNDQQRLSQRLEQQAIGRRLVLVGNVGDLLRQGEDHVKVLDRQRYLSALPVWPMLS